MKRDLVVVGCGIAGISAAVTALQAGLAVTLLERAPEEDFGGNSRWTEAYLRMKNDSEIVRWKCGPGPLSSGPKFHR